VPDDMESKLEIFTLLDKICRPHTILVLNSSTLSITEVASVTCRPQKCVGMRFGKTSPHVEVVRGATTDDDTIAACSEVARRIGREVVVVESD
jgi:3-hydroxybutyryl-CoA dehydrogenase